MVKLYWKNATAEMVGEAGGISQAELEGISARLTAAHGAVMGQVNAGNLGYAALPGRSDYRDAVAELAGRYRESTTDLVVLGIGGSALGNIALQTALNPSTYNLMSEQRHPLDGEGREVLLGFLQNPVLRCVPLAEPGVHDLVGKQTVNDNRVHRQTVQGKVYKRALRFP